MSMMTLYWITRLDGLKGVIVVTLIISFVAIIIFLTMKCAETFDDCDFNGFKSLKYLVISTLIFFVSILALVFTPSTKEIAFIYLTSKVTTWSGESEELQKLPNNVLKLLNTKMEQYIDESLMVRSHSRRIKK
jgi:hypothetical protein